MYYITPNTCLARVAPIGSGLARLLSVNHTFYMLFIHTVCTCALHVLGHMGGGVCYVIPSAVLHACTYIIIQV